MLWSWFGKKKGSQILFFSFFKNYLLDFIVFYFRCFVASRYRNIHMIWKEFWVWNCILHSWEVSFFCSYLDIFTGNSLVERFFSTSDTRQCTVERKWCGHARFVSHMSIISVRWTIMYRLVNIRALISVLFFYSSTSSLKQTRSRKSRITFKSKEDWMFFF